MTKRALISVSDKTNIVEFAKGLEKHGFEVISTGGTYTHLKNNEVRCISIEDVTQFPEILEGRVKTLHPKIHGGLLSKRGNELHNKHVAENNIEYIDLVCVNLYPFEATVKKEGVSEEEIIENIDIGGPSMLRSAAKNFNDVAVVTDINDYAKILEELEQGGISYETRRALAIKVFNTTASYDAAIANYFNKKDMYLGVATFGVSENRAINAYKSLNQYISYVIGELQEWLKSIKNEDVYKNELKCS